MEIILVFAGRGDFRCPQDIEIIDTIVEVTRIAINNLVIPKIGLIRPGAQPEILLQRRTRPDLEMDYLRYPRLFAQLHIGL